jgi:lysophospholipase L1-like esterase
MGVTNSPGITESIGLSVRGVSGSQGTSTAPIEIMASILGDSFGAQHTAASNRYESVGPIVQLNMVTGQRFAFSHSMNFGVSGEDTAQILARVQTVINSGTNFVFYFGGANDRSAKQTAQYSIDNTRQIFDALTSKGITVAAFSNTPRLDSQYTGIGFSAGEIAQAKADTIEFNAFMATAALTSGGLIRYIDSYADMNDGTGQAKSTYVASDGLHLSPIGAFHAMEAAFSALSDLGTKEFTLVQNNRFPNTNFSGTGGNLNAVSTGQVADNHLTVGSAPAGTSSRTYSKDNGQVMTFDFPDGGSAADNFRCIQRSTATYTGLTAYYEVEMIITDSGVGSGVWRTLSAELQTSAGSLSIGFDRAGTTDQMPVSELKQFCTDHNRTLLLRSPAMTVPASTHVEGRVNIEANTTGGALAGSIKLLNEQLVIY